MTAPAAARRIRFIAGPDRTPDLAALREAARRIERLGYSAFTLADHFMIPFAPLIALQAVADATSSLRITQTVLNQDFRHPAVLAKELATLDVLSEGRLQIGIGAGWMRQEYEQAGLRFDAAATRIERLEEVVIILKGLFQGEPFSFSGRHFTLDGLRGRPRPRQRPHPPIMIGGGGRRLLSVAGRQADIVQIMPRIVRDGAAPEVDPFGAGTYLEKIDWVRAAAGERFEYIELGAQLLNVTITDDAEAGFERFYQEFARQRGGAGGAVPAREELRDSPMVLVGTLDEVCARLLRVRDELGISCFSAPLGAAPESLAAVVERLSGR
ncbi:putative F420-dependent oxidoreductase, MSMEG_2516 family [Frankia sp. EI5c]|uniref:TIGR03621 family F420-dependent LLM class oxidoreductase n=1 Tax=Frankia sp. EI5c TaxID=683316 RepID=UPI0007C36943|nr:TIGR03621 family F420-dependent LLM class oxidoreductase [Frankia sp. EI5c]OAA27869.1 putative F420-dependent oxidoreductase, MSMEG_2516 family [Frankia sp. EI5c]